MQASWLSAGRAVCELGIRTLRDEIDDNPDLGREPVVIEAHTALVVALNALDAVAERPSPSELAEAQAHVARAQQAVTRARSVIDQLRKARASERSS